MGILRHCFIGTFSGGFLRNRIPHYILSLAIFVSFIGPSYADDCEKLTRKVAYAKLHTQAQQSISSGSVSAPHWMQLALPEGASYVVSPGRESAPGKVQKEFGPDYVVVQLKTDFNGKTYTTNVGLSPYALADNIFRTMRGERTYLSAENVRGAGVFVHGGGTELSSWANGATPAAHFAKRNLPIVSIDFFGHGVNRPQEYSTTPLDNVHFVPWLMSKYFPQGLPMFVIGHSMGGQVGDLIQNYLDPAKLEELYPGLSLKGIVMLSPPTDPTGGADLYAKISRDREFTDPKAQSELFEKDNINLVSQEPLTDMTFLASWNDALLERPMIEGFAGMGVADDVCYLGNECVYDKYMNGRQNTTSVMYDNLIDIHGKPVSPNHMLPQYFAAKSEDKRILGNTIPQVIADSLKFIENKVLGNKDFDPSSPEAKNLQTVQKRDSDIISALIKEKGLSREEATRIVQEQNSLASHRDTLARVLGLYSKNYIFREFVKNFTLKKRAPKSTQNAENFSFFLSTMESFSTEFNKYVRFLENPKVPVNEPDNWALFIETMQSLEPDVSKANALATYWGRNDAPGAHKFASSLIFAKISNETNLGLQLPEGIPFQWRHFIETFSADPKAALAAFNWKKDVLAGFRDVDLDSLAKLYVDLVPFKEEKRKLTEDTEKLTQQRDAVLARVIAMHAQKYQILRLFKEHGPSLKDKGQEIETWIRDLSVPTKPLESFEGAQEELAKLNQSGLKALAYESFLGPQVRNFVSQLESIAGELNKDREKPLSKEKVSTYQSTYLSVFNALTIELDSVRTRLQSLDVDIKAGYQELAQLNEPSAQKKAAALDVLTEFFQLREDFIRENHHLWTSTSRPKYPGRYYALIEEYKKAQSDYQYTKLVYDQKMRAMALEGKLGAHQKFLYENLDSLEKEMDVLNGQKIEDVGSLTQLEDQIQDNVYRLEDIEEEVIARHLSGFYSTQIISAWSALDNPDEIPSTMILNQILAGWRNVWRDPTGGQTQDAGSYR